MFRRVSPDAFCHSILSDIATTCLTLGAYLGLTLIILAEALVEDIQTDVRVALNSLARSGYASFAADPFLAGSRRREK